MQIKEISTTLFDNFANNHPLGSFYQSSSYALVMAELGYDYDYIGYVDSNDKIVAASLIMHKKIGFFSRYGCAPKGFLIDYNNTELLQNFTKDLIEYYRSKKFSFIKINPEIAIGEIIKKTDKYEIKYNKNCTIANTLETTGYKPLKRNLFFESTLPRFNAILCLKKYDIKNICKHARNKVTKGITKGLELEFAGREGIDIPYDFIKGKTKNSLLYYKDLFNVFDKNSMIDVILVKVNYDKFIIESKLIYEKELTKNAELTEKISVDCSKEAINSKMQSDRNLIAYKDNMAIATKGSLANLHEVYVAGALVIKYQNRVHIIASGYDNKYAKFSPNYFLHKMIFDYYKDTYDFADLNGFTGDFSKESPYYGLNKFKESWRPKLFEYIGEFDLIINPGAYSKLEIMGTLSKEFK